MEIYFWYAELNNKADYERYNACGLVVGVHSATDAFKQAVKDAEVFLGAKGVFSIRQFNKVS